MKRNEENIEERKWRKAAVFGVQKIRDNEGKMEFNNEGS